MGLQVVILAAGKGKRMVSTTPKVIHPLGGIPLLEHVVRTAQRLNAEAIHVIYGNGGSTVPELLDYLPVNWIRQEPLCGTGHAVMQALPHIKDDDKVLVLFGDVPLISAKTLQDLLNETPHNGVGLVVAELEDPTGLGRIIRNEMANITAIVEHKDANKVQRKIKEINTGIMTTTAKHLKDWLPKLQNNNKQKEYYLTDIIALAVEDGNPVGGVLAHCDEEIMGINDRWQLARLERAYQKLKAKELALSGVTIMDPARFDMRGDVNIASDVIIDVNVVLEGKIKIGTNTKIGANVYLKNTTIGCNVEIKPNTVIEDAVIESDCQIGPFARIRPKSVVEQGAKVGNFVEMKKSTLGAGSKASHLTYLGDAVIGKNVNIGAGTITCNYDGVNKWPTIISDDVFIGSNTSLVAPIKIGLGAYVAAGSTITKDAPAEKLSIARAKQAVVAGWKPPEKIAQE